LLVLIPLAAGCGQTVTNGITRPSGDQSDAMASIDASQPLDAAVFDSTVPLDTVGRGDASAVDSGGVADGTVLDASVDVIACRPRTCSELGYTCGINADGCGGAVSCGTCVGNEFCGGGGFSRCGGVVPVATDSSCPPPCSARTCQQAGFNCGVNSDGCGNLLNCGTCQAPDFCGGGGFSVCGHPTVLDGGVGPCVPQSCADQNIGCGVAGDGCGSILSCGGLCPSPQSCGGGGVSNQCGSGSKCVPTTCANLGYECGFASDGCGGSMYCGACSTTKRCIRGRCRGPALGPDGGPTCNPQTCEQSSVLCGPAGDGCGNPIDCGAAGGAGGPCSCPPPPPVPTRSCTPMSCAETRVECGPTGDGCGGVLNCGACLPPLVCGGGGPSKCG
jgi:hypothetical protein